MASKPIFYVGAWDLNAGPQACSEVLPTELSPQLPPSLFNLKALQGRRCFHPTLQILTMKGERGDQERLHSQSSRAEIRALVHMDQGL